VIAQRLTVADHPLLRDVAAYLDGVRVPAPPWRERGEWRADIDGGPPTVDRNRPAAFRWQPLPHAGRLPNMAPADIIASLNYYPPGGAGQGWHTDSGAFGWRIYMGRPLAGVAGCFLTASQTLYDAPGTALAFYVSGVPCASWHAVRAEGARLSVGIRIRDPATVRALGLPAG
jgi:hypothetical protein